VYNDPLPGSTLFPQLGTLNLATGDSDLRCQERIREMSGPTYETHPDGDCSSTSVRVKGVAQLIGVRTKAGLFRAGTSFF
jgi:hypothetical protein